MRNMVVYVLLLSLCLLGCNSTPPPPKSIDKVTAESSNKLAEYWEWHNIPRLKKAGLRKIVISEFNVEFVTYRVDAIVDVGVHRVLGTKKQRADFPAAMRKELCQQMYNEFIAKLESWGFEVLAGKSVTASKSYGKFAKRTESTEVFVFWNAYYSDTGRIKAFKEQPQFAVLTGKQGKGQQDVEAIEVQLLDELQADVSLRARFRVGVYRDHATIENASTILATGRKFAGNVASRKSVLSKEKVVVDKSKELFKGASFEVDQQKYMAAIKKMFPTYIELVTHALR